MLKQFFQSDKNLFIKEVASYFQNFLETDFRKRRLPKRSIKSTDTNGNQITINLLKYTSFRKKFLLSLKILRNMISLLIFREISIHLN